jgi:hypothetical protein
MKLKGKIGVYGRSLGGISATHLAGKYPNIIYTFIGDRTFCDLGVVAEKRMHGCFSTFLYKLVSCKWKTENDYNIA